ncbi:hypothetical protein VB10N_18350 [Vibrio sp. 10N]|nr:hypothetical protein VB10N_18350 [Vibrio sp. 10N]
MGAALIFDSSPTVTHPDVNEIINADNIAKMSFIRFYSYIDSRDHFKSWAERRGGGGMLLRHTTQTLICE